MRAAFAMNAQHLIQFVYAAAHGDDAGQQVVFTSDGVPFTLLQVFSVLTWNVIIGSWLLLLDAYYYCFTFESFAKHSETHVIYCAVIEFVAC